VEINRYTFLELENGLKRKIMDKLKENVLINWTKVVKI